MKQLILILCLLWGTVQAQTIGYLRYDSVKIAKPGGNAELIIENATKAVTGGVLTNTGNGRSAWVTPAGGIVVSDSAWSLTGNSGTTAGTNFIGTTDNIGLMFKTNNVQSGYIDLVNLNTSFGNSSLLANTSGSQNVAIGENALTSNQDGVFNVGVGRGALYTNVSGIGNTAVGLNSGYQVTGDYNTAVGHGTLQTLATGSNNISIGAFAGKYFTGHSNRLFIGSLDHSTIAGDSTEMIIYGAQDPTAANQRLYLNSKIYAPYIPSGVGDKSVRWNSTTKEFTYADTTSGSSTPTWQQTLTAGSTLTGNNTIAGGGFDFIWDNANAFEINSENDLTLNNNTATAVSQLGLGDGVASFNVANVGGHGAEIALSVDSLKLLPPTGLLRIDSLNYSANADDSMMVWQPSTGAVGMRAIPSGGGSGTVNSGTQYRIGYYATTGTAISEAAAITANRALISDANGVPTHATTTATQLGYLSSSTGTTGTASTNLVFSGTPTLATPVFTTSAETPLLIGGTSTTADLNLKTTSGVGASGADMHFLVGNNGATEAMTILNNGAVGVNTTTPGVVNGTTFASVKLLVSNAAASSYITTNTDLNIGGTGILFNRSAANANLRLWAMDSQPDLSNTSSKFTVSSYTDAGSPTNMLTLDRNAIMGLRIPNVTVQYDNTTTTLGNVTGLSYNVTASKKYKFEATLYTTSDVAGGIKVAIGGTATATSIIYEGITTDAGLSTQGRATALGTAVAGVTAVTAAYVTITGTIVVNASGTLTVQSAANAATGTTSVLVGSTFIVTECL